MKIRYTLITLFLLSITIVTQAQIRKGSIWLGGGIDYSKQTEEYSQIDEKPQINRLLIGPSFGYAFNDNLVAGIDLRYFNNKQDNGSNGKYKTTSYSGAVFLRKYWNISSKFYAFAHTNLGYSRDKSTVDYKNGSGFQRFSTTKGWSVSASVTPGIAYSVSKKVQLESTFIPVIRANYSKFKVDYNNYSPKQTDGSDFSIEGGLQTGQYFSLGIRFLLGK